MCQPLAPVVSIIEPWFKTWQDIAQHFFISSYREHEDVFAEIAAVKWIKS